MAIDRRHPDHRLSGDETERRHVENQDRFRAIEEKLEALEASLEKILDLMRAGSIIRRISMWMAGFVIAALTAYAEWRR